MKVIELPCYGIKVDLGDVDPERPGAYLGATITSDLHDDYEPPEWRAALDVVEALVMAHAVAGVDVTAPAYIEGIEAAIDAISYNLSEEAEIS